MVGRVIFGIGCESMYVSQMVFLTEWFKYFEFNLSMGMTACIPNIFSVLGGSTLPNLYTKGGFGLAYGVGACMCLVSLLHASAMVLLTNYMLQKDKEWLRELK